MSDESLNEPTAKPAEDESLAGPTVDTAFGAAKFDLSKWVAGVLPTRRSATLYQRADLLAEIDRVVAAEAVAPKGERADLAARAAELTEELRASGVLFVVEGRTSSWAQDHAARLKDAGVTDATDVLLHQLAAQIVEPAGVTFEMLKRLAEVAEPQVSKLWSQALEANNAAPRIDPRFSRAS